MRQVLFDIPFDWLHEGWHIPVYGYGLMLFLAYLLCSALARHLCKRQGIDGSLMADLAIWLFVAGIIGGRINFIEETWSTFHGPDGKTDFARMLKLWDGGLVLYGALLGGALGYFAYHRFILAKHGISHWKMLDVIAPCVALGIALGRIGCLCTGCCYGDVACTQASPRLHFPYHSPAWAKMVEAGYQSPHGFMLKGGSFEVAAVEPDMPAAESGLRAGDKIVEVNGKGFATPSALWALCNTSNPDSGITFTVVRDGANLTLPAFTPVSIGVNPTQIYETISMCLLLFFLLSYFPYRRRDGELMVFFMFGYAAHRFLDEMLRLDVDPGKFGIGLTLAQEISIAMLALGAILAYFVWRGPLIAETPPETTLAPSTPTGPTTVYTPPGGV